MEDDVVMANLYCITKELWQSSRSLRDFNIYKGKLSREDVATLIETFELASSDVPVEVISEVLKNSNDMFAFLIDRDCGGKFDFYKYLNDHYENNATISPLNSKLMFPRNLSRGIYTEYEEAYEEDYDDDEEGATGYMDADEEEILCLRYDSIGEKLPFNVDGLTIGRSRKESQYVITGNGNLSRKHIKIYKSGSKYYVEDTNSSNGTYINGKNIGKGATREVNVGDVIIIADEKFTVVRG